MQYFTQQVAGRVVFETCLEEANPFVERVSKQEWPE